MLEVSAAILGVILLAVAIVLVLALRKPDSFSVTRSIDVAATQQAIYPLIGDFHEWIKWSPYEGRDPAMSRRYEGAARGKGAIYHWEGNSKVGSGRMEIVDAAEPSRIAIQLDFIKPFEGHNVAEFTVQPKADRSQVSSHVTWTMRGPSRFVTKVMQVFVDFDHMIGKDFEAGLANLKAIAEKTAR